MQATSQTTQATVEVNAAATLALTAHVELSALQLALVGGGAGGAAVFG